MNSIQSIRIRGLESEVSRLISENVSLRARVISLRQEAQRFEAGRFLIGEVNDIKAKLHVKLAQINDLVVDLGNLPRPFDGTNSQPPDSIDPALPRACPGHRTTAPEYDDMIDGARLPTIHEDKVYPGNVLE